MINSYINKMKRHILLIASSAGEGHIASSFSILDLLWVLYDEILKYDVNRPNDLSMDRFILS